MILEIGTIVAARYEIVEQIGAGGMSHVYRAVDNKLHRSVTVKVLREEYISDAAFVERFDREARAIASLSHPNIVNVYDVGNEGDIHFIVMEYIHGKTLKELISERAPFSNESMLGVASQIAAALIHAHESGIIHRDIKPQNILCMPNGVVKVADFGIAKSHDSRKLSDDLSTMGSVHYISPEGACNDPVDPRSDLYSLGIVMFEMMTGELPFDSDNADEITMLHVEAPFPNIRKKNPNVLPVVREIIARLTNKQPFRRYQSASSLYMDMQRAVIESGAEDHQHRDEAPKTHHLPHLKPHRPDSYEPSGPTQRDFAVPRGRPMPVMADRGGFNDKTKERLIIAGGIVTAAALIVGLGFLLYFLLSGDNGFVTVPQHWGQEVETARIQMEALGLFLEVAAEEYSEDVPEGYIIRSEFDDGATVEPGTTIRVVASLGAEGGEMVEVPAIVGLHLDDALLSIADLPLELEPEESRLHESLPQNYIIEQHPLPGQLVAPGTQIRIAISLGAELETVPMPDLVGLLDHAARVAIAHAGLLIGTVTPVDHPVYSAGIVTGQSIQPGTEVLMGSLVDFTVSSGLLQAPDEDEPEPTPPPQEAPPEEPPQDDPTDIPPDEPNGDDINDNGQPDYGLNGDETYDNGAVEFDPPPPLPVTRMLALNPPNVTADVPVTLTLQQRQPDGSLTVVYSRSITSADLPVHVTVQGFGQVEFIMLVDGEEIGRTIETFQ